MVGMASSSNANPPDRTMLLVLFALFGIGLVQVYSSSFVFAIDSTGDALFFFKRQLYFVFVTGAAMSIVSRIPLDTVQKWGWILWVGSVFAMALTLVPGIGHRAGGAARWIQLPLGFRFEPSEIYKIGTVLMAATLFTLRERPVDRFRWIFPVLILFFPSFILLKQPDFGTTVICGLVIVSLLFVAGLRWRLVLGAVLTILPIFYFLVWRVGYRRARVDAFLDPWSDPARGGFQVIQSLLSFYNGGISGVGLGQGQGKLFFLPEAHTDFSLAVLAEETGFVGVTLVLSLMAYLVLKGFQISVRVQSAFWRYVATGLTLLFAFQVLINFGVVIGLLPTKGLSMPFLSYGGSNLVMTGILFGLLWNIQRSTQARKI